MKALHAMLTNSDLIQQAMARPLKYFTQGRGMRQTCVDPDLCHRLLEDGQEIPGAASQGSKLPGEVGVPEKLGKLLPQRSADVKEKIWL